MATETPDASAASETETWEVSAEDEDWGGVNIGETERWASLAGGGALALYGLSRRSWLSTFCLLKGAYLLYRGVTRHCPIYEALGIDTSGREFDEAETKEQSFKPHTPVKHGIVVEKSVTIDRPRAELYAFWRNFENLPRFMNHLQEVRVLDDRRSHWVARAPAGGRIAWDAAITDERENEVIAWHSAQDSPVHNTGSVRFHDAPGGRGTEVKVVLQYQPPAGAVGATVARLFGEEPSQQIGEDLLRFKQLMEAGEIPVAA